MKDGKFDIEAALKMAKMHLNLSDDLAAKAVQISNECHSVTDPDHCEEVFKRAVCAKEAATKMGIEMPEESFWSTFKLFHTNVIGTADEGDNIKWCVMLTL